MQRAAPDTTSATAAAGSTPAQLVAAEKHLLAPAELTAQVDASRTKPFAQKGPAVIWDSGHLGWDQDCEGSSDPRHPAPCGQAPSGAHWGISARPGKVLAATKSPTIFCKYTCSCITWRPAVSLQVGASLPCSLLR